MTESLLPVLYREIEETIPYLGHPWAVAGQSVDAKSGAIVARVYSVLNFSETGELEFRPSRPPGYPDDDINSYYAVKRVMTDNRYEAEAVMADDPDDPMYAANDFYGWRLSPVLYIHEAWYLDRLQIRVEWEPEPPQTVTGADGTVSSISSGRYILSIYAGNNLRSQKITPATQKRIVLSTGPYWGARLLSSFGLIEAQVVEKPLSTTGTNLNTASPFLLKQTYIKLERQTSTARIEFGLYGQRWLGSLDFNTIKEPTWIYHQADTPRHLRLKPPGLPNLRDDFGNSRLPENVLPQRPGDVDVVYE